MCAYVLVAEDDDKQAALIRRYLEHDGHTVAVVDEGQAAIDAVFARPPDLLVLDWMLPVVDGLGVCRRIREAGHLPVLMLTARSTEDDLLLGLDLGADDYMTKPYSPRELMARVRTAAAHRGPARLRLADPARRPTDRGRAAASGDLPGEPVACTPGEFQILEAMAAEPGRVFTRRQLLERTEGFDRAATDRAIDVHIVNLRKKIELAPRTPQLLVTVFGVGYRLIGGPDGA